MDKSIDGGEIIDKVTIKITNRDNAESLYDKVCKIAKKQVNLFLPKYLNGNLKLEKQVLSKGNFGEKRKD